jgi:hypothetical protein
MILIVRSFKRVHSLSLAFSLDIYMSEEENYRYELVDVSICATLKVNEVNRLELRLLPFPFPCTISRA